MVLATSGVRRVDVPSHPVRDAIESMQRGGVNVAEPERIASVIGGGGLALYGLARRDLRGLALALVGGALLRRGATGHCHVYGALGGSTARHEHGHAPGTASPVASVDASKSVRVERSVVIDRPPEELFAFWRNFSNLPRFMEHLEAVTVLDRTRSHWRAKGPAGATVEWDAVIHNERPNELIAWRTVEPADVHHAGTVLFKPASGRGTEVRVEIDYAPPAGLVGHAVAKMFGEDPDRMVEQDLHRLKQLMESGAIPRA